MNMKILGGLGLAVIIALGIYFATANKGNDDTNQDNNQTTNETENNQQNETMDSTNSLKGLLAMGSQQCTYKDGESEGTVYTANGKAHMNIMTVTNGITTNSHAIIDGETYYGWVDGQPTGFKFSTTQSSTGSAGVNQNVDINKQVDYDCSNWSVDNSKFVMPTSVEFMDLTSLQTQMGM